MAYTPRRERCPLGQVETWIFDLDNTLYPASCRLFDQVQRRIVITDDHHVAAHEQERRVLERSRGPVQRPDTLEKTVSCPYAGECCTGKPHGNRFRGAGTQEDCGEAADEQVVQARVLPHAHVVDKAHPLALEPRYHFLHEIPAQAKGWNAVGEGSPGP